MNRIDFYKSIYDRENNRRDLLQNSVNIPFGILTAMIAAIFYLLTNINFHSHILLLVLFFVLFSLCVVSLVLAIFNLLKSYNNLNRGFDYKEIPLLKVYDGYYKELEEHYEKETTQIDKAFSDFLIDEFILCSDNNIEINDKRSNLLYVSKKYMYYALISLALSCIPFSIANFNKPEKIYKILYLGNDKSISKEIGNK